jgi:ferredoxin
MGQPVWLVELIKWAFPARFLIARATRLPILGPLLDRWFFAADALIYLPTDRSIQIGYALELEGQMVLPSEVVDHFIRRASTHWIMNRCLCRDAAGCSDYPVELGCLFLGAAADGINPKLGRRVTEQEALAHVQRCREAGLVHLIGRNKLDTIWLGVGPGDQLMTICHCCPCCCLWRVLPSMAPQSAAKVARMPGVTVVVNDQCDGCGVCAEAICFVKAIELVDGRARISEECRGCGRCVTACPNGAIEMRIAVDDCVLAAVEHLSPHVDLTQPFHDPAERDYAG